MTFPTPYTVRHEHAAVVAQDDLGNESIIFEAPTDVAVQQIVPVTDEQLGGFTSRQITDVDLYVPPDFTPGLQDRITLPNGDLYEVIATADHNQGFAQWTPGNVVKLKRVTG